MSENAPLKNGFGKRACRGRSSVPFEEARLFNSIRHFHDTDKILIRSKEKLIERGDTLRTCEKCRAKTFAAFDATAVVLLGRGDPSWPHHDSASASLMHVQSLRARSDLTARTTRAAAITTIGAARHSYGRKPSRRSLVTQFHPMFKLNFTLNSDRPCRLLELASCADADERRHWHPRCLLPSTSDFGRCFASSELGPALAEYCRRSLFSSVASTPITKSWLPCRTPS